MWIKFRPVFKSSKKNACSTAPFMLFALCAILVGCQGSLSNVQGKNIKYDDRIALKGGGQQTGQFRTEELTIDYEYVQTGNGLRISGTARFSDKIRGLFLQANAFRLALVLGDAQGNGLTEQALAAATVHDVKDPIGFSTTLTLPSQASYMAFSYTGSVTGVGKDGSPTAFFHVPFGR